jgi:hypothetical protein
LVLLVSLPSSAAHVDEVDTQFIFGFTQGADVGELGEEEIESETVGRFGKTDGSLCGADKQSASGVRPS